MKILTRKEQDEILERLAISHLLFDELDFKNNLGLYTKIMENFAEIAYLVGGADGVNKVAKRVYGKENRIINNKN